MASVSDLDVAVATGQVAIYGWTRNEAGEVSWTTVSGTAPHVGQMTDDNYAGNTGSGFLTGNGVYRPGGVDPAVFWCIVCDLGRVWHTATGHDEVGPGYGGPTPT